MEDKTSSMGKYDKLFEEAEKSLTLIGHYNVSDYEKCKLIGRMQAILAAHGIRITGIATGDSDAEGTTLTITYEYKWVPTDGSKAIPRWDTGIINTLGGHMSGVYSAYIRILRIVLEAREALRAMPKQVIDL